MRKAMAYIFCGLEYASMAVASVFTYRVYKSIMSFDLGVMIFIPLMIMSYWFSTFFYQLSNPKEKGGERHCIINKKVSRVLSTISSIVTFGLLAIWVYNYLWAMGFVKWHL